MAMERESKEWKGGAERSHSLEKVTKGTYKFWLFFSAGGKSEGNLDGPGGVCGVINLDNCS
ncbi:hypothetical protein K0M31_019512 [Melipona bicolor]|uniref:Uncharacterized protein n=1 Tax=Melipona bicolor TaxID=60889 RepID=A0AA40G2D3_9HYME|nr:hypothetical protein K0M31_019512 [Melipona bicolor]